MSEKLDKKTLELVVVVVFRFLGAFLMIFSTCFTYTMTIQFGRNFLPQTIPELYCDIAAIIMFATGLFLIRIKKDRK